jgi:NADH-quinone oxidoreductase subunit J
MDSLHSIGFYVSAAVAVVGALLVAIYPGRGARGLALFVAGVGVAGIDLALSAGFTAVIVLVTFAGSAALLARHDYRSFDFTTTFAWRQVGAILAAVIVLALVYAAYRGNFSSVAFNGGALGTAAVGRLLFAHDAAATDAVGVLVLIALAGLTVAWRMRERER